jgi:hypothetical protein
MRIIIFLFIGLTGNYSFGQTIEENQIDEFTKNKVIRTSWEPLSKSGNIYAHARASKINESLYVDFKIMLAGGLGPEALSFTSKTALI